ncbi:MAG: hypothetical protein DRO12_05160, partial [Thermoprotei archaeon]
NIAVFWVKVPSIPANSTKKIYLNVNPDRTEDLSNGKAVFDVFDDFETDEGDWNYVGGINLEFLGDSTVRVSASENFTKAVKQVTYTQRDLIIEFRMKPETVSGERSDFGVCWHSDTAEDLAYYFRFNNNYNELLRHTSMPGDGGTDKSYISSGITWGDVWRIVKIIYISAEMKAIVYVDGTKTHEHTFTAEPSGNKAGIYKHDADGTALYDWVRVRKYTEPEPSVTVVKAIATPTLDLKKMIANCLAGKKAQILDNYPIIRLKSGTTVIKDIQATAKHVKHDEANNRYIVMFLFMDESSDEYTTDNQELWFPHPDGNYLAFTQTQSFTKTADEPLPLRWEIYLPYTVDELDGQIL